MAPAPALSPPMVTWLGSPPNYNSISFHETYLGREAIPEQCIFEPTAAT